MIDKKQNTTDFSLRYSGKDKRVIEGDLKDVADWLSCSEDNLTLTLDTIPMATLEKQAREMLGTYDEFPEDEERTMVILNKLLSGELPLPIFIEKGDEFRFVLEGRHRLVAFLLAGLDGIPVAYASVSPKKEKHISPSFDI